jgi:hypothetical protein
MMIRNLLALCFAFTLCSSCHKSVTGSLQSTNKKAAVSKDSSASESVYEPVSFSYECQYNNVVSNLGIGLVIAPAVFDVYDDSLLVKKYTRMDMHSGKDPKTICSKFYKPDYGIMHFVCIGTTTQSFKVLITDVNIKYLPKNKNYQFKTWENYILESFGVRREYRTVATTQVLRTEPSDNAGALSVPQGLELFCPMEIKGNWLKVKYDCFYNTTDNRHEGEPCHSYIESCEEPLTGWLKWRDKNNLLIDIFLMP